MNSLINTVTVGITTFAATNIDDIIILMLFFSQVSDRFRPRHIVIGQYLGFAVLIAASLPGFFGGMLLPKAWIGLLGLIPITIGLRQFWQGKEQEDQVQTVSLSFSTGKSRSVLFSLCKPQIYHVAAVTIANGGDNISIYVPLFANSSLFSLSVILIVFLGLVSVWCYVASWLSNHRAIAPRLTQYGHRIIPFVLIGLGIYILIESEAYRLLPYF
ncbi:cadmium resistance transporter [Chlorogloea sp. CCALA 695]|uniref:cadmium resistance transporter n=1 Tax=Chlorogloea sp. CCALA 695 TaxID=2107693 RepID=UPI000D06C7EE|nr:cadmium resistance transporter [Chlorogloea sp. CCALA 695]PSB30982.1 transporter [Chlorogloea sp. CCALA 695]